MGSPVAALGWVLLVSLLLAGSVHGQSPSSDDYRRGWCDAWRLAVQANEASWLHWRKMGGNLPESTRDEAKQRMYAQPYQYHADTEVGKVLELLTDSVVIYVLLPSSKEAWPIPTGLTPCEDEEK